MKTLITEHWAGQQWGNAPNNRTRIVQVARSAAVDFRALFEGAYPTFAARCREVDQPGLAIVAVDETTGAALGMAVLRAQVDRHVTAIVGRHDHCDLFLPRNAQLALRQLAVVLGPVRDWSAGSSTVSFRILDLRTADGLLDEQARPLRALRSEGPAMLRCGGVAIFALPLGDATDWPDAAEDAWAQLPERVYHDELARVPDASVVRPRVGARDNITHVTRIPGPREMGMSLSSSADLAGRLTLAGAARSVTLDVGVQALRDGVLLGRYDRCDAGGASLDESVSRVHALLLLVDERLLVIDTGSSNGLRVPGQGDARVIDLADSDVFELGESTYARWSWTS